MDTSSASSDEEALDAVRLLPRPRVFRDRSNPFDMYDERDFKLRFRLGKDTVMDILREIGPQLEHVTHRNMAISAMMQVLITLRFFATGAFQMVIGDLFNVHKSTICRVLKRVTHHIAVLRPDFVHMPRTGQEMRQTKAKFFNICAFPGVLGCVDGTHVPIESPGGNEGELYRNRKTWFSINVQVVCDSDLKFCNIDTRWPGSTHDSTVFNASLLRAQLENGEFENGYLLGDSAYACKSYMMTPLLNPITQSETNYNEAHIKTRNTVERAIGLWKRRFPCIALKLRTKIPRTLAIIVATAVLHNICIISGDDMPVDYMEIDYLRILMSQICHIIKMLEVML